MPKKKLSISDLPEDKAERQRYFVRESMKNWTNLAKVKTDEKELAANYAKQRGMTMREYALKAIEEFERNHKI